MNHTCPECTGVFNADGLDLSNGVICPHCQRQVSVNPYPVSPPAPPVAVPSTPPMISASQQILELAGNQPLNDVTPIFDELKRYTTDAEFVLAIAVQSRLMAVSLKPDAISATNHRVIILRRSLFGMKMWDSQWVDIRDARIEEGLRGASIFLQCVNGAATTIEQLHKEAARKFYRLCQTGEERARAARWAMQLEASQMGAAHINLNVGR